MQQFTFKHNTGDTVYPTSRVMGTKFTPCSFCGNKGHIIGMGDEVRLCPVCYGKKGSSRNTKHEWVVGSILTIGMQRVDITCKFYNHDATIDERYMCEETGVGSGTIHYAYNLHETKEEAQSYCDKKNKKGSE